MTTDAYVEHVRDLLASIPDLRFRKMFGGAGVYSGLRMFALLAADQLYIKTDAASRARFEAAGSTPFTFQGAGGRTTITSCWRLRTLAEDHPKVERWARLGLEAAAHAGAPTRLRARGLADLGPGPWDG
ncbi:MAG: TfoX/Sxy family protein [Proteobacteria bacterium]|nr:TfoX/Sxy family protein [Pseudomonadota bacterium]